jgi:hypothetical protein
MLLVAVDIADHLGEELSTWGNKSSRWASPLAVDGSGVTTVGTSSMVGAVPDAAPVVES